MSLMLSKYQQRQTNMPPAIRRERCEKTVHRAQQFAPLGCGFRRGGAVNDGAHLIKYGFGLSAASLLRPHCPQAVDGEIACCHTEIRPQSGGALRRYGLPCGEERVADALVRVFTAAEYVLSCRAADTAIPAPGLLDGALIPLEKHAYYLAVVHFCTPF